MERMMETCKHGTTKEGNDHLDKAIKEDGGNTSKDNGSYWQTLTSGFQSPKEGWAAMGSPSSPKRVWDSIFQLAGDEEDSVEADCQSITSQKHHDPIPERLVDFFCIVGPDLKIEKTTKTATPSDLQLKAKLIDCYPKRRPDVDFPEELPMFCLPNGCLLSCKKRFPVLSTFVLTTSTGNRLYGSVLTLYELLPLEDLYEAFLTNKCPLPEWLESPKPFYLPKCIVTLSHHAFYAVQRKFLQQLHRISKSGLSPFPLERYIANFVHDVPLPRPGGAEICWDCFTKDTMVSFRRPAPNELPLVNFSYQPLFRCLSVPNILTIWGILLQEGRVVVRSENMALLTPVAEALTSLLFPLTWQGMYVSVLPSSMMDILEAPVPFLVGVVGSDCPQPAGVVVCDLDNDIIHLGMDDNYQPRNLPQLPRNVAMKLKNNLEEVVDDLYLIHPTGIRGRITTASHGLLDNSMREPYAHMKRLREESLTSTHRQYILWAAGLIPVNMPLDASDFILIGEEETKYISEESTRKPTNRRTSSSDVLSALKRQGRAVQKTTDRVLSYTPMGSKYEEEMDKKKQKIASGLYELDDELEHFVRFSFLRFFSSLFAKYKNFAQNDSFNHDGFLDILEMPPGNRLYVESVIKTQMFERFLAESSTRRKLFDEHVIVEHNESMLSKKKETPFLDQQSAVKKIIIPAAPCIVGVRRYNRFSYEDFPTLNAEELVANKTLDPVSALCYLGNDALCSW